MKDRDTAAGRGGGEVRPWSGQRRTVILAAAALVLACAGAALVLAFAAAPAGAFGSWAHDGAIGCGCHDLGTPPTPPARPAIPASRATRAKRAGRATIRARTPRRSPRRARPAARSATSTSRRTRTTDPLHARREPAPGRSDARLPRLPRHERQRHATPAPARTTAAPPPASASAARATPHAEACRHGRVHQCHTNAIAFHLYNADCPGYKQCGACHAVKHAGRNVPQASAPPVTRARAPARPRRPALRHGHQEATCCGALPHEEAARHAPSARRSRAAARATAASTTPGRGLPGEAVCLRCHTAARRHSDGFGVPLSATGTPSTRTRPTCEARPREVPSHRTRHHHRRHRAHRAGGLASAWRWPPPPRRGSAPPARATCPTSTRTRSRRTATSTASSVTPSRARSSSSPPSSRLCSSRSPSSRATTRSPSSATCSTSRAGAATTTTPFSRRSPTNGIRVQHKHLIEAGFLCMRCHSTEAHGDAVPEGSRTYPIMDQCLICHNNHYDARRRQVATSRCDLCHAKPAMVPCRSRTRSPTGARATAPSASSRPAPPATSRRTLAAKCHAGIQMPHDADWIYATRQARPRRRAAKACAQCHDAKEYCQPATR